MSPLRHIRKEVLLLSQAGMASLAGVAQGTVSKWEAGELFPNLDEMARIRSGALARGIEWQDGWFFDSPPQAQNDSHDDQNAHGDDGAPADTAEVIS